ncbi:MAG: hypothetical protein ABIF01_01485, partial [Candidatus Micrarchaeota archaeon]
MAGMLKHGSESSGGKSRIADGFSRLIHAFSSKKLLEDANSALDLHNLRTLIIEGPGSRRGKEAQDWLVGRALNPPKGKAERQNVARYLKTACAHYPELLATTLRKIDEKNPLYEMAKDAMVEIDRYLADQKQFKADGKADEIMVYALGQNGNSDF